MIAVKKSIKKTPQSLHSTECNENLSQVIDTTNVNHKDNIKSIFYRADDVVAKLKNLYHSKCAYCKPMNLNLKLNTIDLRNKLMV